MQPGSDSFAERWAYDRVYKVFIGISRACSKGEQLHVVFRDEKFEGNFERRRGIGLDGFCREF